ncbi:MAG: hypothetical protein K6B15_03570 [Parasporobacterium sp.]|nr:hypothetical protein [Parasporobacterium sp.]
MLEGFLSIFIPALIIIILALGIFLIVGRNKLRSMREKDGSVYKRLFEKEGKGENDE